MKVKWRIHLGNTLLVCAIQTIATLLYITFLCQHTDVITVHAAFDLIVWSAGHLGDTDVCLGVICDPTTQDGS